MSACISQHGEYSDHILDELHTCTRCHVLDEDALRAELTERLRAELERRDGVIADYSKVVEEMQQRLEQADARVAELEAEVAGWPGEVPETRCGRCFGPNRVWVAPSPLWNQVMRGGDINGAESCGIVCPTCFMILAEQQGVAEFWRLSAERVHVGLQGVTPSGRVWNEQTWMWESGKTAAFGNADAAQLVDPADQEEAR